MNNQAKKILDEGRIDRFVSASSIEKIPTEKVIGLAVKNFKDVKKCK